MPTSHSETDIRLEAIAWERAERYPNRTTNLRMVCADGFTVSIQASHRHYADDSNPETRAPYWDTDERPIQYPFIEFEVGFPSEPITDPRWSEFGDADDPTEATVWGFVPRALVDELIASHGGSIGWEAG